MGGTFTTIWLHSTKSAVRIKRSTSRSTRRFFRFRKNLLKNRCCASAAAAAASTSATVAVDGNDIMLEPNLAMHAAMYE